MTVEFALHPQLEDDSHAVATLDLCEARLVDDARFPWVLLIPRRPDVVQILDLTEADQQTLWDEIRRVTARMNEIWQPDRVNLGSIGIVVPQLHVHLVARHEGDDAWPGPVWGTGEPQTYPADLLAERLGKLRGALTR